MAARVRKRAQPTGKTFFPFWFSVAPLCGYAEGAEAGADRKVQIAGNHIPEAISLVWWHPKARRGRRVVFLPHYDRQTRFRRLKQGWAGGAMGIGSPPRELNPLLIKVCDGGVSVWSFARPSDAHCPPG